MSDSTRAPLSGFASDPTLALGPAAARGVWGPVRWLAWLLFAATTMVVVTVPLEVWSQTVFGVAVFALSWLLGVNKGRGVTIMLAAVSAIVSIRYLGWRGVTTFDSEGGADFVLGLVLLTAETYAVVVLLLGYLQSVWPLARRPVPLPEDQALWPTVDVFIPTFNEPLAVVRTTILAARALDWPKHKLEIWVLDDGRRDELRALCAAVGVGYLTRPDNLHAKAGNLNAALRKTKGDLIAIFDCDHVPTRSFLRLVCGWFLRDRKLAMVQTPHHFYSPDPFERNLGTFGRVPNEGELFYGSIQKGNDLWNAAFFCGSCAVIRRGPLEDIGGIAHETVTEDAHTMLRLHRRGWRSAYIDIPQAAGLATESLSAHVGQRIRWARGMAQIFRIDNPLLGRGLSLPQRLCYLSAMMHFFYGVPRIIFFTAPLLHIFFDAHIFNASAGMILAYALPHIAHAHLTNARLQGRHRYSFWAEIYEAALATYIAYPTTLALISPKLGRFNVTAKGGVVPEPFFDIRIALPYLLLLLLNLVGIGVGVGRLARGDAEAEAVMINLAWTAYNCLFLLATTAVAWERQQRRASARVGARLRASLRMPDQRAFDCTTQDISMGGVCLELPADLGLRKDDVVAIGLHVDNACVPCEATVVWRRERKLGLRFLPMSLESEASVVRAVFSRPDAWTSWTEGRRPDRPLVSLFQVLGHGVVGLVRFPSMLLAKKSRSIAPIALAALALGGDPFERALAQPTPAPLGPPELAPPPPVAPPSDELAEPAAQSQPPAGWSARSLEGLGFTSAVRRYNRWPSVRLPFFARGDEVFTGALLELTFDQDAPQPPGVVGLKLWVNDELVGEVPLDPRPIGVVQLEIAPQLLAEQNTLVLAFALSASAPCRTLIEADAWRILKGGRILTRTAPLPLPNALEMLPLPFFDPFADQVTPIHVVFPADPEPGHLRAAALMSGYFAGLAGSRFTFPSRLGELPETHAVLLVTAADPPLIPDLGVITGPTLAMRDNPNGRGSHAKVLIIAGRDVEELQLAAMRLAHDFALTRGRKEATLVLTPLAPLPARAPYDAPRWQGGDGALSLGRIADQAKRSLRGALGGTIALDFRLPPDLFVWPARTVTLDLAWSEHVPAGVPPPSIKIEINGTFLGEFQRADSGEPAQRRAELKVPIELIRGYSEIVMHVVPSSVGFCPNVKTDIIEVEIAADSVLHIEGLSHFKVMPDVSAFIHDIFPFTRMADLSGTLFVLPATPLPEELATALSITADAAAVTGLPASGATFRFGAVPPTAIDQDLLLVGVRQRLGELNAWDEQLAIQGLGARDNPEVAPPGALDRAFAWARGDRLEEEIRRLRSELRPGKKRGYLIGLASPLAADRSALIVTADDPQSMPSMAELRGFARAQQPNADVLVRDREGDLRTTFRVGNGYGLGELGLLTRVRWQIARHWPVLLPLVLLVSAAFAWVMRRRLANLEWRRLSQKDEGP